MAIATGEQILAADVLKLVSKSKLKTATRAAGDASGDVAYAGIGFQPRAVIALQISAGDSIVSIGCGDEDLGEMCIYAIEGSTVWQANTTQIVRGDSDGGGNMQTAVLKTLDADGFTLTWTKTGNGGAGNTYTLIFLCLGQAGEL